MITNKQRTEWNDELVITEIQRTMGILNIKRMPTRKEMDEALGSSALSCKISKSGGFVAWAEKLELQTKSSDSSFGWGYESIAQKDIKTFLSLDATLTPIKSPYDLRVGNCRIDVKVSNKYFDKNSQTSFYSFNINDSNCGSDMYIFYCVDEQTIQKIYIIPSKLLSDIKQLSIGIKISKYDAYLNRWDLITSFDSLIKGWMLTSK